MPKLHISGQIFPDEIDLSIMDWLDQFAPFGPGNMRPVFLLEDAQVVGHAQIVGSNHLRMQIRAKKTTDCIGFGMANFKREIENSGEPVNLTFVMERNHYYGYPKLQLRLKDIQIGNWKAS